MTTVIPLPLVDETQARRRSPLKRLQETGVTGMVSALVLLVALTAAVVGPYVTPSDPNLPNLSLDFVSPSGGHVLGYDFQGRDVFSRLLAGAQSSLLGPLMVVTIGIVTGVVLALVSTWRGGALDTVISSALNILFAFPAILLAVLATAVFGAGLTAAALALAVAYTPYVARVLRGAALRERNRPYVAALEVQGASATAICLRHLLPNLGSLIVAQATILFGYAMVDLAAISFLGLGVQPPAANWGVMIAENQQGIPQGYPLPALVAGSAIVLVVIAVNLLGERLFEQA
ncbi:MAG: peptide/nickel transport system permease protein [Nocardioidaceae bacterium]|nr:peptide/nickel transport system permease protein [Nocardioidaceae bacterium]